MPELKDVTDPYLPEPKGIATASEGMVYRADGAGSGDWVFPPQGMGYYQHSTTGQVFNTTPAKLAINGGGTLSTSAYLPREFRGLQELWDTALYKITPYEVGDSYEVRIDIPVTAETGSPTELTLQFDAGGTTSPTTVLFERFSGAGKGVPYTISITTTLTVLTSLITTNGVQIFCSTDSGTMTIGTPAITVTRQSGGSF